jgi:hypothetical protein
MLGPATGRMNRQIARVSLSLVLRDRERSLNIAAGELVDLDREIAPGEPLARHVSPDHFSPVPDDDAEAPVDHDADAEESGS